ncbi:DUF4229 domain-containing protein [Agrococcus jenensis]|uniref:Uncharacterized protein DUF4229 n=1 Tax=Agrococcus jenensis TaxID=46353 RepID=A0A3N2APZ9_9MICO|nr:DUF4229 domain-containing protein [Agrococcus jenensis]ROR65117.1 uncharacterized protein DUF4229 [Agrococcus jenensis]
MAPSMRYLIARALLFVVPFAVLMIAQVPWWLSLLVALAFAFAASIVFFGKLRNEAAADLQRMREGRRRDGAGPDDGDVEDAALGDDDAEVTDRRDEPDASGR